MVTPSTAAPADTRERILGVSRRRFAEQGYDATSLREIAEELGFTKAALYYHFPSKVEILRELFEPMRKLFLEMSEQITAVPDADDPIESFAEALESMVREVLGNREVFAVVERNRHVITDLLTEDLLGPEHRDRHSSIADLFDSPKLPLHDRIRMACALAAVTGLDDWAPSLLTSTEPEELETELIATTRAILGLPADRDGATS